MTPFPSQHPQHVTSFSLLSQILQHLPSTISVPSSANQASIRAQMAEPILSRMNSLCQLASLPDTSNEEIKELFLQLILDYGPALCHSLALIQYIGTEIGGATDDQAFWSMIHQSTARSYEFIKLVMNYFTKREEKSK